MIRLNSFNDFMFENIDLSYLVITPKLRNILDDLDDEIGNRILDDVVDEPIRSKVTVLDINNDEYEKWWYVNSVKVNQYFKENDIDHELIKPSIIRSNRDELLKNYKSTTRIGRIINKIYPDEYKPTEIEIFVNKYKKYFTADFELIDIVKGKDINKWYNCDNYEDPDGNSSELHNSCMSSSRINHFMDMYSINDDKISMVILYSDENKNKINARALLWKPDNINGESNTEGRLFMDRIYYINQKNKLILEKYAENNGWYRKEKNDSLINCNIYDPKTKKTEKMILELENIKIPKNKKFPFVDTLAILDPETHNLSNDESANDNKNGNMGSTGGAVDGLRWIDSKNRFYHTTDLVEAEGFNGPEYVLASDIVYVKTYDKNYTKELVKHRGGLVEVIDSMDEFYKKQEGIKTKPKTYKVFKNDTIDVDGKLYYKNDLNYSDKLHKWFPRNLTVWSKTYNTFIPVTHAVEVITHISKKTTFLGNSYYPETTDVILVDDPKNPYFKHTDDKLYLTKLKKELEEIEKN